jgi:hypothetical protein
MLAEKRNSSISIAVPTHRYSRERMQDPEVIKKPSKKRNITYQQRLATTQVQQLIMKFGSILESIDYLPLQERQANCISQDILKIQLLRSPQNAD